ncbi:DinB family protein [Streptomyces sp. NPDC049687]|uniref:DinB family protein n=1 Tax=Streptomyces sp. NPDC049687 TaxID=3365596 RepID=UPI0037AF4810
MTDIDSPLPARTFGWSDKFAGPEDDPRSRNRFFGERATLVGYLRDQRLLLRMKCEGLGAEDLARRSVPPSDLSLLGLVRHLARVEHHWFRHVMAGQPGPLPYWSAADPDLDFSAAVADPEVVAEAWETWRSEVAFAERFVDEAPHLDVTGVKRDEPVALREVLVHMIEEYARHHGHADFLRERIDGRVGR